MKLRITRTQTAPAYTLGKLEVEKDGKWVYLCDTLEHAVREAAVSHGKLAIPSGLYRVTASIRSPVYSNYSRYPWARQYLGCVPRVIGVDGFDGILIHPNCLANTSSGCIVVGRNARAGKISNTVTCWRSLMEYYFMPAKRNKETITLEIT